MKSNEAASVGGLLFFGHSCFPNAFLLRRNRGTGKRDKISSLKAIGRAFVEAEVTYMMLRKLYWIVAIIFSAASYSQTALADPRGLWLAQDGAQVRVAPCGGYLCAILEKTKSPVDPETGQPWTDRHSHDPAQRNRPLIGTAVLNSLVPDGPGKWSGRLYNVDNGESYEGHLLELNARTLRVEGCAVGMCGGQDMLRIQ